MGVGTETSVCAYLMLMVAVCTLLLAGQASGKRVLLMPSHITSHTKYHTNIARALNDIGHEVWVCMPSFMVERNVLDTTGLHVLEYKTDVNIEALTMSPLPDKFFRNETENVFDQAHLMLSYVDDMLMDKEFGDSVRKVNPNLIVIDSIPTVYLYATLAYRLDVPFAIAGSHYDPMTLRVPFNPGAVALPVFQVSKHMTFPQRVVNFAALALLYFVDMSGYSNAVARYAPGRPHISMEQLMPLAEVVLVESDHILDYPQPVLPNVIRIGGAAISEAKPLTGIFKDFVEKNSREGVIVVSFGSMVVNLPDYVASKMSNAFQRLKYKFVWRVNMSSPEPGKILTSTWIPQNDLVAHPNVRLFVSHCGKNGQYEALYNAKPTLCLPLFGDQWYAAERTRSKGWSLTGNIKEVTADDLVNMITELMTNSTYRNRIATASEIFKVVQGLPVKRAAFWLDHVMKYGGAYMRYAGQEMPAYKYFCLDLIAFFGSILGCICFLCYVMCSRCFRKCFGGSKATKNKRE